MKYLIIIPTGLAIIFFYGSCNKGPTGGIPFYMQMDTAVVYNPGVNVSTGDNTQFIADVWPQAGASNLGAYELPCNFPVLERDSVEFVVNPGVWQTGQPGTPVPYPLMKPDVFTILAVPGLKYTHVPHFSYLPSVIRVFMDDFQTPVQYFDSIVLCRDSNARYGGVCGRITVSATDSAVTATQLAGSSPFPYALSAGGQVWLELDYKCQVPFWVGLNANFTSSNSTDQDQILLVLPSATWNKLYINCSGIVNSEMADTYEVFFQALNPSGNAGGSVYLDNITLLHL